MKIQTDELFLKDLYFYDIKSCYAQIADSVHYKLPDVDRDNKAERNIAIGKEQIGNPGLTDFMNKSAEAIVSFYLTDNNVDLDDIVLIQRDGCILKKLLKNNSSMMTMDLRAHYNFMIITPDRSKYMAATDDEIIVKGVANRYPALDKVYMKFKDLNFYNKKSLFKQLNGIRKLVLGNVDSNFYLIEHNKKRLLMHRKRGLLEMKSGTNVSMKSIEVEKYYDVYFRPFIEVLFLYFY